MQTLRECEFFLVRYVPDPVKNEFVNIGVLLREPGGQNGGETLLRFTRTGAGCAASTPMPMWRCWRRWRSRSRHS